MSAPDSVVVAEQLLAEARALVTSQRGREVRDRHRALLARAIAEAERWTSTADRGAHERAWLTMAAAHAALSEDALHGANQLSLSAQRAPSLDECTEGWVRVAALVQAAHEYARATEAAVRALDSSMPRLVRAGARAAARALAAAEAASALLSARNDAYVFHTAPSFSFGEGWHVAAAAILANITIQIPAGEEGASSGERFLRDAGLLPHVQSARPRPRATKQVTGLVARAFREDASLAQHKLRVAFLGDAPISESVRAFADERMGRRDTPKVLLWIRRGTHQPERNSKPEEIERLVDVIQREGATSVLVGDEAFCPIPEGALDLSLFWKAPLFQGEDRRRAQLQFFEHLRVAHQVRGQLGVTTAGMDGAALLGLPTAYLTEAPNPRMRTWVGAIPGYAEIVRIPGDLEGLATLLRAWIAAP